MPFAGTWPACKRSCNKPRTCTRHGPGSSEPPSGDIRRRAPFRAWKHLPAFRCRGEITMGSLFGSILSATNSMRAFQQGLNVVQSNVVNASTAGYVKQTQSYSADTFDIAGGLAGGVTLGPLLSSRNEYAEQLVRNQQHALGEADQRATDLAAVEP